MKPVRARSRFEAHVWKGPPRRRPMGIFMPEAIEGRTTFVSRVRPADTLKTVLKSGAHNRKIGSHCVKGRWRGMPIYTLALEERKTCPRDCKLWHRCYGNNMPFVVRVEAGPALEAKLEEELCALAAKHSHGFIVRLHVLGDFYSTDYVLKWLRWLRRYPSLRVFGYTAHQIGTPIGDLISNISKNMWQRFAVRTSNSWGLRTTAVRMAPLSGDLTCPAQTGKSACCGTCSLCWQTEKPISFLEH